jgi:uncharacterized NAD(P)/FAD-binding protein YdhS
VDSRASGSAGVDVAIVGFGFAGLATLAHLVERASQPQRVAVVAEDTSGHGVAYGTRNPAHLLNVPAERMGAWAHSPEDFSRWLRDSPTAERCCALLGVPVPEPEDYAPRALFAHYLDSVRELTVRHAHERGFEIEWITETAERINRDGDVCSVTAGPAAIRARSCVLATGHELRSVFGAPDHPDLHEGPWQLTDSDVAAWDEGPVVLVGTGLTAIDALLSVRSLGFRGRVVAFSRSGQLPRAHRRASHPLELAGVELDTINSLDSLPSLLETFQRAQQLGQDWRIVIDALRPHTSDIWQRFSESDQTEVVRNWSTVWSVHRHRMAPQLAERISEEIGAGQLRIAASRQLITTVRDEHLQIEAELPDGTVELLRPAAVIDCTGPELRWSHSHRTVLRGLLEDETCTPHHTGLGVVADQRLQVAEQLYAIGSALTGQLWESVAVPELRDQAATIAAQLTGVRSGAPARSRDTVPRSRNG